MANSFKFALSSSLNDGSHGLKGEFKECNPLIREIRDIYCGVMKSLADMPSCLGGEDNRINIA